MSQTRTALALRSVCESASLQSVDVRTPEAMALARQWFAAGVRETKQASYAARIGVAPSVLSEMISGERPRQIHLVQALPLLAELNPAKGFIGWGCHHAGLLEPEVRDTVQLSTSEAALLSFLMRTPLWRMFLGAMIAREFYRVDVELLEAAVSAATKGR